MILSYDDNLPEGQSERGQTVEGDRIERKPDSPAASAQPAGAASGAKA